jgi:hypothetical protein
MHEQTRLKRERETSSLMKQKSTPPRSLSLCAGGAKFFISPLASDREIFSIPSGGCSGTEWALLIKLIARESGCCYCAGDSLSAAKQESGRISGGNLICSVCEADFIPGRMLCLSGMRCTQYRSIYVAMINAFLDALSPSRDMANEKRSPRLPVHSGFLPMLLSGEERPRYVA